jgi:hypothetical protein
MIDWLQSNSWSLTLVSIWVIYILLYKKIDELELKLHEFKKSVK